MRVFCRCEAVSDEEIDPLRRQSAVPS